MAFNIGDAVVIWHEDGAGIYDGSIAYVRELPSAKSGANRYGLSDVNEGNPRGYVEYAVLLTADEFKARVLSGEVGRKWQGEDEKLTRIYKRYK